MITKEKYQLAKDLVKRAQSKNVRAWVFLRDYNLVTGRREMSNCPSCQSRRFKLLQILIEEYEKANGTNLENEQPPKKAEPKKEPVKEEPKKKRGRPAGSKNKTKKN